MLLCPHKVPDAVTQFLEKLHHNTNRFTASMSYFCTQHVPEEIMLLGPFKEHQAH